MRPASRIAAVCWDWNGTLLDDTEIALATMNAVLRERGLAELSDVGTYRQRFRFPVRDFYADLGIAPADFREAAGRYLDLFAGAVVAARLHPGAAATLAAIGELGVPQVMISATIMQTLRVQMAPHRLEVHFDHVLGITDAYAASKTDIVAGWVRSSGHDPQRVLMVGDTNHDEEIAEGLGVGFVRFARGHQRPPDDDHHPVVHDLAEVLPLVRR